MDRRCWDRTRPKVSKHCDDRCENEKTRKGPWKSAAQRPLTVRFLIGRRRNAGGHRSNFGTVQYFMDRDADVANGLETLLGVFVQAANEQGANRRRRVRWQRGPIRFR